MRNSGAENRARVALRSLWEPGNKAAEADEGTETDFRILLIREFHIQMRLRRCRGREDVRTDAGGSAYRMGKTRGSDGSD